MSFLTTSYEATMRLCLFTWCCNLKKKDEIITKAFFTCIISAFKDTITSFTMPTNYASVVVVKRIAKFCVVFYSTKVINAKYITLLSQ